MSAPAAVLERRGTTLLLAGAVLSEVTATLALRAAVDHAGWYVVPVLGYPVAFGLLALTLARGLPVGVAYGTWAASGVALTAVLAVPLFAEHLSGLRGAGIGLIVVGVVLVEVGSHRPGRAPRARRAEVGR